MSAELRYKIENGKIEISSDSDSIFALLFVADSMLSEAETRMEWIDPITWPKVEDRDAFYGVQAFVQNLRERFDDLERWIADHESDAKFYYAPSPGKEGSG